MEGDETGTVILGPYESGSFTVCSSLCTGFLGASQSYYYSYYAETDDPDYDCSWGGDVRGDYLCFELSHRYKLL